LTPEEEVDYLFDIDSFANFNPKTNKLYLKEEFLDEFLKKELQ